MRNLPSFSFQTTGSMNSVEITSNMTAKGREMILSSQVLVPRHEFTKSSGELTLNSGPSIFLKTQQKSWLLGGGKRRLWGNLKVAHVQQLLHHQQLKSHQNSLMKITL